MPQDRKLRLEHLRKADLLTLIKRMVEMYPDLAELIEIAQQTTPSQSPQQPPFNPEFYRRQVNEIFSKTDRNTWGSEGRAAGPLLQIVDIGNEYVEHQKYAEAATLYDIIIRGILSNYDSFRWHPYEGDLDEVIEECVEGLGRCLLGERG